MGPGRAEFVSAFSTAPRHIAVQLVWISICIQEGQYHHSRFVTSGLVHFDSAMSVLGVEEVV